MLSFPTNRTENLRTTSGALVLTAIQETFGNYSFTSAAIITKDSFNLTRSHLSIEVRASFPSSDFLHGAILLLPGEYLSNHSKKLSAPANVNNTKVSGYFSFPPGGLQSFKYNEFSIINLDIQNGKHVSSSWSLSGSMISQSLDNREVASFKLAIMLSVESESNEDFQTVLNKSKDWGCSSMIIDYIEVFDLGESASLGEINRNLNRKQASEICLKNRKNIKVERKMKFDLVILGIFLAFIGSMIFLTIFRNNENVIKSSLIIQYNKISNKFND